MGHSIRYFTFSGNLLKKKVRAEIACMDEYLDYDRMEQPYGVAENVASELVFYDDVLGTYDDAEKFLGNKSSDKWYHQCAVKYRNLVPSSKQKNIEAQIEKLECALPTYEKKTSVKSFKAEFIVCKECGCKLKRTLLKSDRCPLCRRDLRADTTLKTIASKKEAINVKKKELNEQMRKDSEKGSLMWLVRTEVHC